MTTVEVVPIDKAAESARPDPAQPDTAAADAAVTADVDLVEDAQVGPRPEAAEAVCGPRLDAIEARLADLTDTQESTGSRVGAVESTATTTAGQVASVEADLQALRTESAQQQAAVLARVDAADGTLTAAEQLAAQTVGRLDSLTERLTAVDTRLEALTNDHDKRAAGHDKALADVQRSIAAEVERHTSDALVESQHRLQLAVNSIAQLALAMAESSTDITEDLSAESASALLESFKVDLDAILSQLGFEALGTIVGDTFDPHRHRALKRNPTSDPKQDKVITRVIRDGYRNAASDRILLFADVEVSRHRS